MKIKNKYSDGISLLTTLVRCHETQEEEIIIQRITLRLATEQNAECPTERTIVNACGTHTRSQLLSGGGPGRRAERRTSWCGWRGTTLNKITPSKLRMRQKRWCTAQALKPATTRTNRILESSDGISGGEKYFFNLTTGLFNLFSFNRSLALDLDEQRSNLQNPATKRTVLLLGGGPGVTQWEREGGGRRGKNRKEKNASLLSGGLAARDGISQYHEH